MTRRYRPNLYFLMETKSDVDYGKKLACRWGFNYCDGVASVGRSGGILLFWDDTINVTIKFMNKNIIYAYVTDHHHNNFWLACLYGHPEAHLRQNVWNQLIEIVTL